MEEIWDDPEGHGTEDNGEVEGRDENEEVDLIVEPAHRAPSRTASVSGRMATLPAAPARVIVEDSGAEVEMPTWAALAPILIPIHDKHYAFGRAASFAEFTSQSSRYGTLLRNRYGETRLPAGLQAVVTLFPDTLYVLAIVTEEDPDTLAVLPVVARLLAGSRRFDLRVVSDEDASAPLSMLLPEVDPAAVLEEWDLPQFLCFDEDFELVAQWGPRPAAVEDPLERWLGRHPEYEKLAEDESPAAQESYAALVEELIYEMRVWYNSGANRACLDEWRNLLMGLLSPEDQAQLENEVA